MSNPWFRMYHEFATDPKVQMLSEADQRRYVMLLCLCCKDNKTLHDDDEVAFCLRITGDEWADTKQRFIEKGLLDEDGAVAKWEKRQHFNSTGHTNATSKSENYIYFVAPTSQIVGDDVGFLVKIGISKNPWARLKELQTGNHERLKLAAKFRSDIVSDAEIHELLGAFRKDGEWFELPNSLKGLILSDSAKKLSYVELRSELKKQLRTPTATTTDTDTDTDTDTEEKPSAEAKGAGDEKSAKPKPDPVDVDLAEFVLAGVRRLKPNFRKPNLAAWADDCRKMRTLDNRSPEQIRRVFKWANNDKFWQVNILSPGKLREKFDALELKSAMPTNTAGGYQTTQEKRAARNADILDYNKAIDF